MNKYKILNKLKKFKSICLITHYNPDGDAIGSTTVFRDFLKEKFKINTVDIFAEISGSIDYIAPILDDYALNPSKNNYDCAILLDVATPTRAGTYENLFLNAPFKVIIDHHIPQETEADILIRENISSTCELVFKILKNFKHKLSTKNKGRLYTGMMTDTANFTVGNFNKNTIKLVSEIIDDIDHHAIYQQFLNSNSIGTMNVLSVAIKNIKQYNQSKILISQISHTEAKSINATPEDYSHISNKLSSIKGNLFSAFIYPKNNEYYVSLRSKPGYNVAEIANKRNGGGHIGAAAFKSNASISEIKTFLLSEFREQLNKNSNTKPFSF